MVILPHVPRRLSWLAPLAVYASMLAAPPAMMGQTATNVDPVKASPDKYRVLLENDHVRVVDYIMQPGARDEWHKHPPKVSYVLDGGTLRITLADSTSFLSEEKSGEAGWRGAVPLHYARNVGTTSVRIVLVEPKAGFPVAPREEDPALVNQSSIKVLFQNDSVRAMEAVLPPGYREKMHTHPGYVTYVLDGGRVRLHMADGTTRDSEFKTGNVFYSDPIKHWAENTGTTTIRVLLVELRTSKSY